MRQLLCVLTMLLVFVLSAQTSFIANSDYVKSDVLIELPKDVNIDDFLTELHNEYPELQSVFAHKKITQHFNIHLLRFKDHTIDAGDYLQTFRDHPSVVSAQLEYFVSERNTVPNDPSYLEQWALERIEIERVWEFATGGTTPDNKEIVIAIIDSGYQLDHPDLEDNIYINEDEVPNNGIDEDENGFVDDINGWNFRNDTNEHFVTEHGTQVIGIAGAAGDNSLGGTGINWNVKMMLMAGRLPSEIAAAYEYIWNERRRYNETDGEEGAYIVVTNASLGISNTFCGELPIWGNWYDELGQQGILSVVATDNTSSINVDVSGDMPASCPSDYMIAVTNSNIDEQREGSYGKTTIDLTAPGTDIFTTNIDGGYRFFGGTSAACPTVAGTVALLHSLPCTDFADLVNKDPAASVLVMKDAILNGVDKLANLTNETVTGGRLNAYNSAEQLHSYCIAKDIERSDNTYARNYLDNPDLLRVYPLGNGTFGLDFGTEDFESLDIAIYDAVGRLMLTGETEAIPFVSQTFQFDASEWGPGIYFLTLRSGKEKVTIKFRKV